MLKVTFITPNGNSVSRCFEAAYHTISRARTPDTKSVCLYREAPSATLDSLIEAGYIDEDMSRSDLPADARARLEPAGLVVTMYVPTSFVCMVETIVPKADDATYAIYSHSKDAWYNRAIDEYVDERCASCEYDTYEEADNALSHLADCDDEDNDDNALTIVKTGEQP